MHGLLGPGLVAASSSDEDESSVLAPLAETGFPEGDGQEDGLMDQDLYGFAIHALVRDTHPVSVGDKGTKWLRFYRLLLALGTLFLNFAVQLFLAMETRAFLTSKAVHDIRQVYSAFEVQLYGNDPSHMEVNTPGHARGKPEFFQPELFETLDPDFQAAACTISLSQPRFLGLVLFVWSLTCATEIKRVCELFMSLIMRLPRASRASLQLAVMDHPDGEEDYQKALLRFQGMGFNDTQARGLCMLVLEQRKQARKHEAAKVVIIAGLTPCMKVFVSLIVLLPRLLLSLVLLWLGCRWITATMNFDELLLNVVALAFIISVKDLLFHVCISARGKCEMGRMRIRQPSRPTAPLFCIFMGAFLWGLTALIWALVYVFHLQSVLPDYKWDVHKVCQTHMKIHYSD